jgi:D-alanyl-lipoteichoic acid acyltransferase DltB (MBOAT superfamily)
MLFNTLQFWLYFVFVFGVYLLLPRRRQNLFLLAASYLFYACWDWRFLGLLLTSSLADWYLGNAIFRARGEGRGAKRWVAASVTINLVFLGFFKYFNFFVDSADRLLGALGLTPVTFHVDVILPVGISFYTFQSMSYIVDVYRGESAPAEDPLDFLLFVAFFPHMVAGPIMHSADLLPQMQRARRVRWAEVMSGFNLAMWGLYKKVVVADNLAAIVGPIFARQMGFRPGPMQLGAVAFAFQIYCDFSGYTDIARGVARMMGFRLMDNFHHPYLSSSITDFWRRWHISLSTWLRDYLYIPLGGNRHGTLKTYRNLFLTMLLGGVWHGAGWTFVLWGAYQGALLVVERLLGGKRLIAHWAEARSLSARVVWGLRVMVTFYLVCLGWILFRCETPEALGRMIGSYLSPRGWFHMPADVLLHVLLLVLPVLVVDLVDFFSGGEQTLLRAPWPARILLYAAAIAAFVVFGRFESDAFIYFQF